MPVVVSRRRYRWLPALTAVLLALGIGPSVLAPSAEGHAAPASSALAAARPAARPNVLLITADDMRADDLKFMPFTSSAFRSRGVTFADALSPYPLCCPARAQILTGQYNHNNGVLGNGWPLGGYWAFENQRNTLPRWLARSGYRTGFVGKYLNQYGDPPRRLHVSRRRRYAVPPGWRDWYASVKGVHAYTHVRVNVDTPSTRPHREYVNQYQTEYFGDVTANLIDRYHRSRKPFFIWASHLAPHAADVRGGWRPPIPAPRDRGRYAGIPLPESRAYRAALNAPPTGKYGPMQRLTPKPVAALRRERRLRAESLRSLDRAVKQAVRELRKTHEYGRTVIIFTSDNGYALGEHRYRGKDRPYEPELRVPMIVNAPGIERRYSSGGLRRKLTVPQTVTTTDIPATIVGVTGVRAGRPLDGIDMSRPAQNPDSAPGGDRAVLIESGPAGPRDPVGSQRFVGVRTDQYTWLAWNWQEALTQHGPVEYYDRLKDAGQVQNMMSPPAGTAGSDPVEPAMQQLAYDLRGCSGAECVRTAP
jgi:N-acetylglucosamine-6-sulfatase